MTHPTRWLLQVADAPIRHIVNQSAGSAGLVLENGEAAAWLSRLAGRSLADDIGAIHGSHDYRMENILGKCWILGLSRDMPAFAEKMAFILRYLSRHIEMAPPEALSFEKIYHFRDDEKVLACFLPFLGYHDDPAVLRITRRRLEVLYRFTRQKRYDIYIDGAKLKGVKPEWQPYVIDPDLYADGHIALPDMHDFLLLAGMLPFLAPEEREKAETIAGWLSGGGYAGIIRRYGYFYVPGGSYKAKAVIFKLHVPDLRDGAFVPDDLAPLVFNAFVLSHFRSVRASEWFSRTLRYFDRFKSEEEHYRFPPHLMTEKPDNYVIFGGHMNVGENRKSKRCGEILSTYWMERIRGNMDVAEEGGCA